MRAVEVVAPHGGGEAVDAVVGQAHGFVLAVERGDCKHRAEHFVAGQVLPGAHAGEDGRFDEVVRAVEAELAAATGELRAVVLRLVDEAQDAGGLLRIDDGAGAAGRVQRIAGRPVAGPGDQALDEFVVDRAFDQQPRVGRADFALVEENAESRFFCRKIEIAAIGEHEVRALAAAFQPDLLEVGLRGVLHEVLADLGRAGEHQRVDVHVQAEGLAGGFAEARHHVQHAFREARFQRQFGQAQGGERRLLGGLEHHRVAGGQRRGEFPGGHVEGEVPRHHRADHAQRHAGDGGEGVLRGRGDLVVELVDAFRVPGEHAGGAGHVDVPGVHHRLAHVQRVEQGQFLAVGEHQFGELEQHRLALARRHARPGAVVEGIARGAHGGVDLDLAAGGDVGQQAVGRRVDGSEGSAVGGGHAAATDQGAVDEGLAGGTQLPVVELVHQGTPAHERYCSGMG
ncbi:hypothetical protein D9M71_314790 [compost metagenome]